MEKRLPLQAETILQERYEITKLLGAGGMGAVYEAYDRRTSAYIALKETFATDEYEVFAFEREAKLLANLDHEALPRVMDYFAENDGYFLVMELIRGEDLEKLLSQNGKPFEVETVLDWANQILDALEDLHLKGIIHRDIKPANIKLTPRGKIKLIDFGIAKGTAGDLTKVQTINAASGSYSPLEQILKVSEDAYQLLCISFFQKTNEILQQNADERADIFALGATLYQLLTNRMPVNAPTRALAIWSGQGDKLISADQINPQIPNDVSQVLWQALEIDRTKRPATAIELRKKLRKKINPQPLPQTELPRPTTTKKSFLSRRKFLITSIFFPLFLFICIVVYFMIPERVSDGNPRQLSGTSKQIFTGHTDAVFVVKFSPDGKTIASGSSDKTVKLWDVASGKLKQTLSGHNAMISDLAFSPDGKTIASNGGNIVKIWNVASGAIVQTLVGHNESVLGVVFSPDGKTIASGSSDKTIKLWDSTKGTLKQTLDSKVPYGFVSDLEFSPDGKVLAGANSEGILEMWETIDGKLKTTKFAGHEGLFDLDFSPDGKMILSGGKEGIIILRDAVSGNIRKTIDESKSEVMSVGFSSDGKMFASSRGSTIEIWNTASGTLIQILRDNSFIYDVAFSPDGKKIASASMDKTIKIWDLEWQSSIRP